MALYPPPHGTEYRVILALDESMSSHIAHIACVAIGEQVNILAAVALESLIIDCIAEVSDIKSN